MADTRRGGPVPTANEAGAALFGGPVTFTYTMQPLAAAVVAALNPGTASGQQAADDLRIEEIVVTATKREMNLQDLGQSISVVSTRDIEKQAIQGLEDVVRVLPSVALANSQPGRNTIVFRGLSTGTQEYYTDSQVAVYLDEQPITTISQQPELRLIDIARVESLPGPQGTLFGSSSQSGTIRYITNRPEADAFSAQVGAGLSQTSGGDTSWDLNGWVNIPIIEDRLAIRAVAYATHEGGWVDNVLGTTLEGSQDNAAVVEDDYNEWDSVGGRLRARWVISDRWEADLAYIMQQSSTEGAWESDPALGEFRHTKFFKEFRDDDWYQASATVRGDLGFADLTVNASYFDRDIVYEWDNMVYEQWKDAYWGPYYALYNSDYTFGTIFNDQIVQTSAFEARLVSKSESRLRWMIGGFYEDNLVEWYYGAANPDYVGTTSWYAAQAYAYYYGVYLGYDVQYPLPATTVGYSETYSNSVKQTAFFGSLDYDITDNWTVNFGARWFEYDRRRVMKSEFPAGLPPFGSFDTGGVDVSAGVESDTVYKFGTSYNLSDDVMVYALYSEGFRLGGNNSARAADTGFVPLTFLSDKVGNGEIGIKTQLANGRVRLNVNYFDVQWDDIQINQSSVNGQWWLRGTVNGGKGENKGVEYELNWQATDRLYLYSSGSFGDPKYTEDIQRISDVIPAGTPMVWAYKRSMSIGIEYTIPDVFGGDLWFGYNHTYQSSKWNNITNAVARDPDGKVPAWDLANAHVGLTLQNGWEWQLTARNIWDERAINALWNDSSGEFFGDPRFDNMRTYARPRTIGLQVRKRFD